MFCSLDEFGQCIYIIKIAILYSNLNTIFFSCRNNSKIDKVSIMESVAQMVKDRNLDNRVDLKNPEKAILIEIIKGNCGMGILPHYYKYKKYNLLELCGKSDTSTSSTSKNTGLGDSNETKDQEEDKEKIMNEESEKDAGSEQATAKDIEKSSTETPEADAGGNKEQVSPNEIDPSSTETKVLEERENKNDKEPEAGAEQDSAIENNISLNDGNN